MWCENCCYREKYGKGPSLAWGKGQGSFLEVLLELNLEGPTGLLSG